MVCVVVALQHLLSDVKSEAWHWVAAQVDVSALLAFVLAQAPAEEPSVHSWLPPASGVTIAVQHVEGALVVGVNSESVQAAAAHTAAAMAVLFAGHEEEEAEHNCGAWHTPLASAAAVKPVQLEHEVMQVFFDAEVEARGQRTV